MTPNSAFVESFDLPPTAPGSLDGLTFAVKDLIDIAGWKTGCGNPTWRDTHPPAVVHAVCVEQPLAAGARCIGKTITDELAFSLLGENHFFGTPLNPAAPDRVPGGSSSGSASAVASGLVDFALGTDTGGSVRVPASNCGIWGFRPSHGVISVAGVNPFAPTFDTVGVFARSADVLGRAARELLGEPPTSPSRPKTIAFVEEAFDLVDAEVRQALLAPLERLQSIFGDRIEQISLRDLAGGTGAEFSEWLDAFCVLQWAEIKSSLGAWVAEARPEFGPAIAASFELTNQLDRRRIAPAARQRERFARSVHRYLGKTDLLCIPTTPQPAPLKGASHERSSSGGGYYPRALSLTSIAGVARLPQVSMPLAAVAGAPVGLSLLARNGQDAWLLDQVAKLDG